MLKWAENEVKLACSRERATENDITGGYACACYEAALDVFKVLLRQAHSGASIMYTKDILNRLIELKPLTPLTGEEDEWEMMTANKYRNKRKSGLYKEVLKDGAVTYSDVNRVICQDKDNDYGLSFSSNQVTRLVNDMFPITFPYWPTTYPYVVTVSDTLYNPDEGGGYDTRAIWSIQAPDKKTIVQVNRFFKEGEDGWVEITEEEYNLRTAKT